MAKKNTDPTELREKVRCLGRTAKVKGDDGGARHRQSKIKNLRRSLKKSDEMLMSAGGYRSWVEVDEAGCLTGQGKPDWLNIGRRRSLSMPRNFSR
jgi:hypothetical protein